jgi:hypothetical protein
LLPEKPVARREAGYIHLYPGAAASWSAMNPDRGNDRMAEFKKDLQLASYVDLSKPRSLLADARDLFSISFPRREFSPVTRAFNLARDLYQGSFPGYRACAVDYHNHEHTLTVFAAAARLMDGCILAGMAPGPSGGVDTLVAALLHDTGYIQEQGDNEGTGAKYTKVHVERSAAFVRREAAAFCLPPERAERIGRIIRGTDLGRAWESLEFSDDSERLCSEILAAADLLGQMADRTYLEKLLFLFYEFREAGLAGYETAYDILRKTAGFYEMTGTRLNIALGRVSRRSREHFARRHGIDRDLYREAIDHNMAYLDSIMADDSTNFRVKLKRIDWAAAERSRPAMV